MKIGKSIARVYFSTWTKTCFIDKIYK